MNRELKTQEDITEAYDFIVVDLINALRFEGVSIGFNYPVRLTDNSIVIQIPDKKGEPAFGCNIDLTRNTKEVIGPGPNKINFATTGSFNPSINNDIACKYRVIGEIISNWDKVDAIIEKYCDKYIDLEKEIKEQQK